jgi:hypothetical protein
MACVRQPGGKGTAAGSVVVVEMRDGADTWDLTRLNV